MIIKMFFLSLGFLLFALTFGVSQEVEKPKVSVIYSGFENYKYRDVFDEYFVTEYIKFEKFENKDIEKWIDKIGESDAVLTSIGYNLANSVDFSLYKDKWMKFLRGGGVLCLTGVNNPMQSWASNLDKELSFTVVEDSSQLDWLNPDFDLRSLEDEQLELSGKAIADLSPSWIPICKSKNGNTLIAVKTFGSGIISITSSNYYPAQFMADFWNKFAYPYTQTGEIYPLDKYEYVDDTRPNPPKTLLFGSINLSYLKNHAQEWVERGFKGILVDSVMSDWSSDIWATDGDPLSRGADDLIFQEFKSANEACEKVGMDSNFVKVAFYTKLPDWFDNEAWAKAAENFRQAAIFARDTKSKGVAIDTEYVSEQYSLKYEKYDFTDYSIYELRQKVKERGNQIIAAMIKEYPEMDILVLPEGIRFYGILWTDLFEGMLQPVAEVDAPGGLHLLTEWSYNKTSYFELRDFLIWLEYKIRLAVDEKLWDYWQRRCSIALGAWPAGYYREIKDKDGKFLGYSGKKEKFGDKVVGSYADKSTWYSPEEFRQQVAAITTFCKRYNWIYAHGAAWWQITKEEMDELKKITHHNLSAINLDLPDANIEAYYKVLSEHKLLKLNL